MSPPEPSSATKCRDDLVGEALDLVERLVFGPEDERVEAELEREARERLDPVLGRAVEPLLVTDSRPAYAPVPRNPV